MKLNIFLITFTLLISGCGGDNGTPDPSPEDNSKDRKEILTHWADHIIVPSYNEYKIKFDAMKLKGEAFIASPEITTLTEFRTAWVEAYSAWQKIELFEFGAADRNTFRSYHNIYPADVAGINANISNPSADLEIPLSYSRQGFPALDYLINGVAGDDASIVSYYTGQGGTDRKNYVSRLLTRMNTLLNNVMTEWNGTAKENFTTSTGLGIGSSMGLVVNAYILNYERHIRTGKIGIPAGALTGTTYPEKVEAFYKRNISLQLVKVAHQASHDFFNGKSAGGEAGPSFKTYLDALDAKDAATGKLLSTIINEQFELITQKLNALSGDLYQQVETDNGAMLSLHSDMQKLVRLLKIDMTSAMSVTITYTDNDGD